MSKAKRKSGLFGWLSSLFGGNKPVIIEEQAPQYERVGDEYDSNASIVAVSRAENSDVAKSDATTDTASPNQPNQSTTEPRTAPAPINLPKSGVLAQQNSKPNIFTKYMENGDNAAQAESVQDNVNENAKAEPSIQVQTHNQPALKVKITAVVRQPEERAAPQIMQPETPAETETVNKEETATPVIEPAATVIQTQASTPVTPLQPPVGALANYINQASMAWLPESMKHPATSSPAVSSAPTAPAVPAETQPTVVENAVVKTDDDAVDVTELVSNVEPIVLPNTTVPEVELPVAEEILAKQQAEQAAATQQQNDAPRIQVNMPKITVQVAPKKAPDAEAKTPVAIEAGIVSKQTVAEHKVPQITVQATPAAPKQAAAPIVPTPVAEPVLVATQPETPAAPAPASNAHNSFASVFRRHTLQTEQANHADEAHNVAEPVETEEPAQIVLNRSESLTQAPTQAAQAEAPSEEGLTAPSVSNYSSNPNRYNQGIFF